MSELNLGKSFDKLKELNNYEQWQLNKYGNIVQPLESMPLATEDELFESGIEELNRLAEWIESQNQQQLLEHEK